MRPAKPACFFAGWRGAGPCDGRLVRAHLIPQQVIKRAVRGNHYFRSGFDDEQVALADWLADPRSWVPCCGGPVGLSGHHGMLDVSRSLRIPRADLPVAVEVFAAELGLGWWLAREYGEAVAAA